MNKTLLVLIAVGMIWFGWNGMGSASSDPAIIPLQTAAPAPARTPIIDNATPKDVCIADRLLSFGENEHREPNQLERNQITFGCMGATWAWSFAHFAKQVTR